MKTLQNSESVEEEQQIFTDKSDICQQLLNRYAKSSAAQHRHLCATAAATRSIIQSETLPLTPLSYFAATIDAISDTSKTLDADAFAALSSFLSIVLPLLPEKSIAPEKATEALRVLVEVVVLPNVADLAPTVRAVVKSIGVLVGFCDLEDWESVKLGLKTLVKFSTDKRPKVRKCAQDCVVNVFKAFESSMVIHKASKLVLSSFKAYMKAAVNISSAKSLNGSNDIMSRTEHLEVLHMLNLLKHLLPYLSPKVRLKALSELLKLMTSRFSALTRHIFDVIKTTFESIGADDVIPEADRLVKSLSSYASRRRNPSDTVLTASYLLKISVNNIRAEESITSTNHLLLVIGSLAGLLTSGGTIASQASKFLQELINCHIDVRNTLATKCQLVENVDTSKVESVVKSVCAVFTNMLSASVEVPNEHILAVISVLFLKLGDASHMYMKDITHKLANLMSNTAETEHLQECIGSAVIAMGPEKLLDLIPISLAEDHTCSNIWLIPILKNYINGASLGFFIDHIVPLAESFAEASHKVKNSVIQKDLQAHAHDLWDLLPSFCRYPVNMHKNIKSLAKLMIPFLKEDSFMIQNIAISLQVLVNQNKGVLSVDKGSAECTKLQIMDKTKCSTIKFEQQPSYSTKAAERNLKALAACSEKLLRALAGVLFHIPVEKRGYLKDAIGCLASITDPSVTEKIFIALLEKLQRADDSHDCGKHISNTNALDNKEESILSTRGNAAKRCIILELAYAIADGANKDLVDQIFNLIKQTFQEADEVGDCEAYLTLNKILEKHTWFCSSRFNELMELLVGLKLPVDIISLRSRFSCFQTLLIHAIKTLDDEDKNTFIILNEIILTLKNSDEVIRKAAYDILLGVGSCLQCSSSLTPDGPYFKLINMIMGYLSGSSPHIKSGAVSALSVLVHNDANICLAVPDLVPSVLELLQNKAIEVIKAVLGFVKVLVLTIQVKDLQMFLSEIVNRVLPWSSVSRHHFRSKVTVILEIMMRKCGSPAVKSFVPEKYKTYVKSVLENHRGKSTPRETGDTDIELKLPQSSPRGWRKRKHQDFEKSSGEGNSMEQRKQKWEAKHKGNVQEKTDLVAVKKRKNSQSPKITKGRSNSDSSTGKRKMEMTNENKKRGAKVHRTSGSTNSLKPKSMSRERQKR